jgi:hypothetical protein
MRGGGRSYGDDSCSGEQDRLHEHFPQNGSSLAADGLDLGQTRVFPVSDRGLRDDKAMKSPHRSSVLGINAVAAIRP